MLRPTMTEYFEGLTNTCNGCNGFLLLLKHRKIHTKVTWYATFTVADTCSKLPRRGLVLYRFGLCADEHCRKFAANSCFVSQLFTRTQYYWKIAEKVLNEHIKVDIAIAYPYLFSISIKNFAIGTQRKTLSREIHIGNINGLSLTIQPLWPRLNIFADR